MRLTTFTDYCLRVLMYVGAKESGPATIDEIANSYGISRNHLMKVVFRLGQLGYLTNVRGKGGGIYLARDPAEIGIGKLVRETEEDLSLVECFLAPAAGASGCRIAAVCILRNVLAEALKGFLGALDKYTLADLLGPRRKIASLLEVPPSDGKKAPRSPASGRNGGRRRRAANSG